MERIDEKEMIRIVPECGHGVAGHWGDKDSKDKGALCWHFEQGSPAIEVKWPASLLCRYCHNLFTKEEIQKNWIQPVYYSHKEGTFNCGCFAIDSSD